MNGAVAVRFVAGARGAMSVGSLGVAVEISTAAKAKMEAEGRRPITTESVRYFRVSNQKCAECGKTVERSKLCGECRMVGYCGKACQQRHWASHRAMCSHLQPVGGVTEMRGNVQLTMFATVTIE